MTTYPLTMPSHTGIRSVSLRATNAVAYDRSPFTFAGQAQASAGQMWEADVSLPPMKRADAEVWIAWLTSLRGQYGTFLMGDPSAATPRGLGNGTPLVNGAGQTGDTLNIDGCGANKTNYLRSGDYIQLGAASSATLHKVLEDVSTDGSGQATLTLWPHIRTAPANNSTVVTSSAVGNFRLSSNSAEWSISEASIYGINFSAMEAV